MNRGVARRTTAAAASIVLALTVVGCAASAPPAATPPAAPPRLEVETIAVVGDSISLGVNACDEVGVCPAASWATGTDAAVDSIARRLSTLTGTAPEAVAVARPGAGIAERGTAFDPVRESGADLIVVLVGANDACAASVAAVTAVDIFAAGYRELLAGVRSAAPDAAIVAYSVPDLLQLWELGHTDAAAVRAWNSSTSCGSLLANAESKSAADTERRAAIDETVRGYNAAIAESCAEVNGCTSDGGAVYDTVFTAADVSALDHFHPSLSGQAVLAASAWPAVEQALGG